MPSSSSSSRFRADAAGSPGSSLPPGNSQKPARGLPTGRSAISTRPSRSRSTAATTSISGSAAAVISASSDEASVALLVLESGTAGTRLVAAHLAVLAHEGRHRLGGGRLTGRSRGGGGSRRSIGRGARRLGVLELHGAGAAALLLHGRHVLLGLHPHLRQDAHHLVLQALEHGGEHLEGVALVFAA